MNLNSQKVKQVLPYAIIGGGLGLVMFLKNGGGNSSQQASTNTQTDPNQVAGTLADNFNQALNQSQQQLVSQTNEALAEQKQYYDNAISQLTTKIGTDEQTISTLTGNLQDVTSQNQQLSGAIQSAQSSIDQLKNNPVQNNTPPSNNSPVTVQVKQGSVDEQILRAEYGNNINFDYSGSGYVGIGKDRAETNKLYEDYLASKGVKAGVQLTTEQMNNVTGTVGR